MKISVFTPTFNRAHTINRVYNSLLKQTVKDFEWIIVDDGSNDGTSKLVDNWIKEGLIPITYIYQNNKGKFLTLRDTIYRVNSEWFLIADSDDEFVPETIQTFLENYSAVPENQKGKIVGVTGLVVDSQTNNIVGNIFPIPNGKNYLISSVNKITYQYGVSGEKWGILKTAILKEYADKIDIPDESVKYIGEQALWAPIGEKYLTVFINIPLRIYYQGSTDTLSTRNIAGRYPLGAWITERVVLPYIYQYFFYQPKKVAFSLVKLNYASFLAGKSFTETVSGFPFICKLLMFLTRPIGYIAKLKYPKERDVN